MSLNLLGLVPWIGTWNGSSGTGIIIDRPYIWYNMSDVVIRNDVNVLLNKGSAGGRLNAQLFSGRHLVLDATQELPIEVPYTLGGDGSSHTMGLISTGGLTTTDNLDGSYNVAGTVSGASAYIEIIDTSITTSVEILCEFQVIINSGSAAFDRYFDGTSVTALPNGSQTILNGANKVELKNRPSRGAFLYIPDGTTIDMDITPTSIKQITTPANTAITYWDATAKEYVQDASIPVSTTYTFTNQSVGEIAPTTKPFDTADIALMNADNQLLGQLALGSTTTGLSLVTADLYGYYPVSELSGAYVVDSLAGYGSELVTVDPTPSSGIILSNVTPTSFTVAHDGSGLEDVIINPVANIAINKYYVSIINIEEVSGTYTSGTMYWRHGSLVNYPLVIGDNGIVEYTSISPVVYIERLFLTCNVPTVLNITISVIEATASEITNYLSTVRTNGDTSTYGMQLVGFKQDSLGLPTAVADAGTTEWFNDGRTATTGWAVTAPFTVTEYVGGATQGLGNELASSGTTVAVFTTGTGAKSNITDGINFIGNGDSTLDTDAYISFELTSSMTIGEMRVIYFDYVVNSGETSVIQIFTGSPQQAVNIVLSGSGSFEFTVNVNATRNTIYVYFDNTSAFNIDVTNFTTKQIIGADIYTFTSDGNRYKNTVADGTYTLPTGEWTLNDTAFDGVTVVTARGDTQLVSSVVIP